MRGSLVGLLAALICLPAIVRAQTVASPLPPGEGREAAATLCITCHTLQPILMKRDGPEGWKATVDNMVMRGSSLFLPGEPELVTAYLARSFGPSAGRMETGLLPPGVQGTAKTSKEIVLPDGPGKVLVEQRCGIMCHDLGRVVSANRTRDEWGVIAKNMSARALMRNDQEIQAIVSYHTDRFGR